LRPRRASTDALRQLANDTIRRDLPRFTKGVTQIPKPDDSVPVVSLSPTAFPVIMGPLMLEEGDLTSVQLGFIAIADYSETSKLVCLGHIDLFAPQERYVQSISVFLEQTIRWGVGNIRQQVHVCLLDLPPELAQAARQLLADVGFAPTILSKPEGIDRFHAIVCMSNCAFDREIDALIPRQVCLVCGAAPSGCDDRFRMNAVLTKYGIGFSPCKLRFGPLGSHSFQILPGQVDLAIRNSIVNLVRDYQAALEGDLAAVPLATLDTMVTVLGYHIAIMPQGKNDLLERTVDSTLEALERLGFCADGGICRTTAQGILMVLILDAIPHLAATFFIDRNFSELFPGRLKTEERVNESFAGDLGCAGWHSTGFYLGAGEGASVTVPQVPEPPVWVQVGSHGQSIIRKPGPWKRWPIAVNTFEITDDQIRISSMFGGIIYIVTRDAVPDFQITFDGVARCPLFHRGEWNVSNFLCAPFCEIASEFADFTVPSEYISEIPSLVKLVERMDFLLGSVIEFTADPREQRHRVVLDIELPTNVPICEYPIVLGYDSIHPILIGDGPSSDLFCLLMFIGVLALSQQLFDEVHETCLAALAANVAMSRIWPTQSIIEEVDELPPKFRTLLIEYSELRDEHAMTRALAKVRERGRLDGQDMWDVFVNELIMVTGQPCGSIKKRITVQRSSGTITRMGCAPHLQPFFVPRDSIAETK
jgi:hypothetical protein